MQPLESCPQPGPCWLERGLWKRCQSQRQMDGCRQQTHLPPGSRAELRSPRRAPSTVPEPELGATVQLLRLAPSHLTSPTSLLFLPQFDVEAKRSSGQPCHVLTPLQPRGEKPITLCPAWVQLGRHGRSGECAPGGGDFGPWTELAKHCWALPRVWGRSTPPPPPVLWQGHKAGGELLALGPRTHRQPALDWVQATSTCGKAQPSSSEDLCGEREAGGSEIGVQSLDNAMITEGTCWTPTPALPGSEPG